MKKENVRGTAEQDSTYEMRTIESLTASRTNPRKEFSEDALNELAASIKEKGLIEPLLVRYDEVVKIYEIVCGERRFRAAQIAGLSEIPCIVKKLTDQQVVEIQIVENMQRTDLSPIEEAQGYKMLIDVHGYSWDDLAAKIGKSKQYIHTRMHLITLIPQFQKMLQAGKLKLSQAEQIIRLVDPEDQKKLIKKIYSNVSEDWSDVDIDTIKSTIEDDFLLQLKRAPFLVKSKDLNPGPCAKCTKRTGAHPDLFGEDLSKQDACQDPTCWKSKKEQYKKQITNKFKSKSKYMDRELIVGEAADKILGSNRGKYEEISEHNSNIKGKKTWAELLKGTEYKPVIVIGSDEKPEEYVQVSKALKVIPRDLLEAYAYSNQPETPESKAQKEYKEKLEAAEKFAKWRAAEDVMALMADRAAKEDLLNVVKIFSMVSKQQPQEERSIKAFGFVKKDFTPKAILQFGESKMILFLLCMTCGDALNWRGDVYGDFAEAMKAFNLDKDFETLSAQYIKEEKVKAGLIQSYDDEAKVKETKKKEKK